MVVTVQGKVRPQPIGQGVSVLVPDEADQAKHPAGADNSSAYVSGLMVPAACARGTFHDDTLTAGPLPLGDDDRPCCDWPISP